MVVPSQNEDEDAGWEWVHAPPGRYHLDLHLVSATLNNHDNEDKESFCREDDRAAGPSAGLLTNTAQFSENLSSTASSPILKHSHGVMVMPKEHVSELDALQHSATEWIEPQLVFSKHRGIRFDNYKINEVAACLQKLPKAKEALLSLLADPVVFDAVMRNKAFKEFTDINNGSERLISNSASTSSSLHKRGIKAYRLMRQKLRTAVDILLSSMGRDKLEATVTDELDAIAKSCISVVALLVFLVIAKRSNEVISWEHVL